MLFLSILVPLYGSIAWQEYIASWEYALIGPASIALAWGIVYLASRARANRGLLLFVVAGELLFYVGTYDSWHSLTNLAWNMDFDGYGVSRPDHSKTSVRSIAAPDSIRAIKTLPRTCFKKMEKIGELLNPFATIDGYAGVPPRRQLIYDLDHPGTLRAAGVTHFYNLNNRTQFEVTSLQVSPALARGRSLLKRNLRFNPHDASSKSIYRKLR